MNASVSEPLLETQEWLLDRMMQEDARNWPRAVDGEASDKAAPRVDHCGKRRNRDCLCRLQFRQLPLLGFYRRAEIQVLGWFISDLYGDTAFRIGQDQLWYSPIQIPAVLDGNGGVRTGDYIVEYERAV